jgi:hypothetical protein
MNFFSLILWVVLALLDLDPILHCAKLLNDHDYVQAPTLHNLYHSVHCGIFVVIFIVLCTRAIEDLYLNYVCYTILLFCTTFSTVALPGQTEHTIYYLVWYSKIDSWKENACYLYVLASAEKCGLFC